MNILRRRKGASNKPSDSGALNVPSPGDEILESDDPSPPPQNPIAQKKISPPPQNPIEQKKLSPHRPSDGHLDQDEKKKKTKKNKVLPEQPSSSSPVKSDQESELVHPSNTALSSSSFVANNSKVPSAPALPNLLQQRARNPQNHGRLGGCLDTCCWLIGYVCCLWWMMLVLYKALPSLSEAITGPYPDPPGVKLKREGFKAHHPTVFVPSIVTGGLELWEGQLMDCSASGYGEELLERSMKGLSLRPPHRYTPIRKEGIPSRSYKMK